MSSCPRPSRAHSRGVRACGPGRVRAPLAAARPADPSGARGPDIGERLTTRPRPYPDAGPVRAQSLTPFPFVSFSRPVLLTTERRRPPSTSGAPFGAFLSAPALISPEQVGRMASSSSHSVSFSERRRNSSSADSLGTFQTIRFSASRGPCRGSACSHPCSVDRGPSSSFTCGLLPGEHHAGFCGNRRNGLGRFRHTSACRPPWGP